ALQRRIPADGTATTPRVAVVAVAVLNTRSDVVCGPASPARRRPRARVAHVPAVRGRRLDVRGGPARGVGLRPPVPRTSRPHPALSRGTAPREPARVRARRARRGAVRRHRRGPEPDATWRPPGTRHRARRMPDRADRRALRP